MDVGGEVVEAVAEAADSPVCVVEARERLDSWAATFDSTVDADLYTVGEDQPFMESRLPIPPVRPDFCEPLATLMPPDSE